VALVLLRGICFFIAVGEKNGEKKWSDRRETRFLSITSSIWIRDDQERLPLLRHIFLLIST